MILHFYMYVNEVVFLYLICFYQFLYQKTISEIRSLRLLDLSHNEIDEIPSDVQRLRNLVELHLDGNKIASISGEISHLRTSLRTFSIANNILENEPSAVRSLCNLTVLNIGGNRSALFGPLTRRADGYIKTNEKMVTSNGKAVSVPISGYLSESVEHNIDTGGWYSYLEPYSHDLLVNRAKNKPWKVKL